MTFRLVGGDAIEAMQAMAENSVDAIVTDPPYNLSFMGKAWDGPGDHKPWATEALRILKPGGHLLAFGGTRTYHRLACAIEDAGFEIRDCIAWMYGSGFPKSLDVSKAIDKAAGVTEWKETRPNPADRPYTHTKGETSTGWQSPVRPDKVVVESPEAQRWNGWGTALKPAFEPIVLARKPLSERNVAANVQRWGTGALNIDGCRIEGIDPANAKRIGRDYTSAGTNLGGGQVSMANRGAVVGGNLDGRWPANVTLDETAAAMLDEQTGELTSGANPTRRGADTSRVAFGEFAGQADANPQRGLDVGGASRFFYCPKADREERNRGLGHLQGAPIDSSVRRVDQGPVHSNGTTMNPTANHHPTVKPVELMRWLCRMVTPKGGTVLDPFTGSGSTGVAAMREGFEFIGIEREAEYVEIARARIVGDAPLFNVEVGVPTE